MKCRVTLRSLALLWTSLSVVELAFAQAAPPPDSADAAPVPIAPEVEPSNEPDGSPPEAEAPQDGAPPSHPGAGQANPSPGLVFQSRIDPAVARDVAAEEPDDGALGHHQDHFVALLGIRAAKISSTGFDPFAATDELVQLTLGAGKTMLHSGNLSLAGVFLWDVGGRSAEARGAESGLIVHRLSLGVEGRYHFIRQLYAFARVAPGALHSIATLDDDGAGDGDFEARRWVFATDLSLGAMLELSGWSQGSRSRRPSVWIGFDGGYGFAGESQLSMTTNGGPERGQPVELGALAMSGPFFRGGIAVTY